MAAPGNARSATSAPNAAGFCPAAQINGVPDGRPDVLMSALRVDYPTSGPDSTENYDVGVAVALDGATGAVLQTYRHPDPDTIVLQSGLTGTIRPGVGLGPRAPKEAGLGRPAGTPLHRCPSKTRNEPRYA